MHSAGPLLVAFFPAADFSLQPARLAPSKSFVKIKPKCLLSGCWMSGVNSHVLRTSHAVGYPVSEDTLCCWVDHKAPNCGTPRIMGPPQHMYPLSADTL